MFSSIKKHLFQIISVFALVAVVASLFTFVSPVYASSSTSEFNNSLVAGYKSELAQWKAGETNLKSDVLSNINKFKEMAEKGEAYGEDTSSLEMVASIYQSQVETAIKAFEAAHEILNSHNGFDNNGNIVDPYAAGLTVSDARLDLNNAQNLLSTADSRLDYAETHWLNINKNLNSWLKMSYQNEQYWFREQKSDLDHVRTTVNNVQNLISWAKGKGKDTTALVNALAAFQSQISSAQSSQTAAGLILATHAGFDTSLNVTNQPEARATITSAGQDQTEFARCSSRPIPL